MGSEWNDADQAGTESLIIEWNKNPYKDNIIDSVVKCTLIIF